MYVYNVPKIKKWGELLHLEQNLTATAKAISAVNQGVHQVRVDTIKTINVAVPPHREATPLVRASRKEPTTLAGNPYISYHENVK
jgi:hypothetical protein